jgi:hypothetical protein
MLVDAGIVPKEFLPKDETPEGTVTDSGEQSKPAGEGGAASIPIVQPVIQGVAQ